ncbi:MAG: hypothetical protein FJX74_07370 [Armatimonadetes bacterium]|nr:hypothetical protein [Armatimonadota bacterium]
MPHEPLRTPSTPAQDPELQLVTRQRPRPRTAPQGPWRGLALIGLVGGATLLYLCLLVRVSAVDVSCHDHEMRREELRSLIATDMTELSALSDMATNLDQAQRNGLCPAEGRDRLLVSPQLCRPLPEAGAVAPAVDTPALAAGLGTY